MKLLDKTLKYSGVEMSKNWNSFLILMCLSLLNLPQKSGKRRLGWTEDGICLCLPALNKFMVPCRPMQARHSYTCDVIIKQI